MRIDRRYRLSKHIGGVRKRLANMIVAAFEKEGMKAACEPENLRPAQGYWRHVRQDVYSWEGYCRIFRPETGKWDTLCLGSWDRMSSCIKGITIEGVGFGYEICATNELSPSKRFKATNT